MAEKTINYIKLPDGETYRVGAGLGFNLFDTKVSDHILEDDENIGWALQGTYVYKESVAGTRTGYANFYNKCVEEKENSTATETTLGDSTITMYVNANGHKFYDISDKTVVDNWYNTYGIADFYGIDLVNERIFLPRNDYFVQLTGDISKVNDYIEAGLPNIEATYKSQAMTLDTNVTATGALYKYNNDGYHRAMGQAGTGSGIGFDASLSNPIYGNSDTVQPPSSLKLLYYCVGNTKVESAISNVTEITTSENDTLPLFHNFYSKEDMTTTGAYVNASLGSWLSGNVYTTAYNELVNKLGTDNVKASTDTYTDYDFVVNQDNMTFRLPIKNGQEIMFATRVKGNGMTLGLTNGSSLEGLCFSADGIVVHRVDNYGTNVGTTNTGSGATTSSAGITTDSSKSGIVLDTENITIPDGWNLYYKVANAVTNLELLDVAKVTADLNTKISKTECPAYIVETYQNGTSWYRVYSDGWCEQGGHYTSATAGAVVSITFLKEYINTDYTFVSNGVVKSGGTGTANWYGAELKNNTNQRSTTGTHIKSNENGGDWVVQGYIK